MWGAQPFATAENLNNLNSWGCQIFTCIFWICVLLIWMSQDLLVLLHQIGVAACPAPLGFQGFSRLRLTFGFYSWPRAQQWVAFLLKVCMWLWNLPGICIWFLKRISDHWFQVVIIQWKCWAASCCQNFNKRRSWYCLAFWMLYWQPLWLFRCACGEDWNVGTSKISAHFRIWML